MTDNHRLGRAQTLIGSAAVAAGLMVSSGVWAAPAYATCSPQARPCITDVVMKDPTTLVFNWTEKAGEGYQVRYHSTSDPDFLGIPGGTLIPENQFKAYRPQLGDPRREAGRDLCAQGPGMPLRNRLQLRL